MLSSRSLVSTWAPTSLTRTTQKPSTTSLPFPTTTEEWEEATVSLISSISPFQLPILNAYFLLRCRHCLRQEQRRRTLVPFRWLQRYPNRRGNCSGNAISLFWGNEKTCSLLMLTLPFFADQSSLRALLSEARRHMLSDPAICSVGSSARH